MSGREQSAQLDAVHRIGAALVSLQGIRGAAKSDEDVEVAIARLENWLVENRQRWVR